MKIKPKESFSNKSNAYFGQMAAFEWLQTKNIGVSLSDIYKNEYEKEFDDFCKAQAQKEQELKQAVVSKFGYLKAIYSRLKLKILLRCPRPYVLDVHGGRGRLVLFLF
ncbi:hypothetical protein [Wielerella bovis]|uniref:hypothetical protein n=1 Tax=Wielerella bovis TaxID=2917790 RepID=UPI002019C1A2|nr:hypothetical protein [Wielerella bovis]MCG7657341.1 hypothetical protein [Wielerella bovis]MCG7659562.1 hypothetical protein [Wielerella bovis]